MFTTVLCSFEMIKKHVVLSLNTTHTYKDISMHSHKHTLTAEWIEHSWLRSISFVCLRSLLFDTLLIKKAVLFRITSWILDIVLMTCNLYRSWMKLMGTVFPWSVTVFGNGDLIAELAWYFELSTKFEQFFSQCAEISCPYNTNMMKITVWTLWT